MNHGILGCQMCGVRKELATVGKEEEKCCVCFPHDNCGIRNDSENLDKQEKQFKEEYEIVRKQKNPEYYD